MPTMAFTAGSMLTPTWWLEEGWAGMGVCAHGEAHTQNHRFSHFIVPGPGAFSHVVCDHHL